MADAFSRCPINFVKPQPGACTVFLTVKGLKEPVELTCGEAIQLASDLLEIGIRTDPELHRAILSFVTGPRGGI